MATPKKRFLITIYEAGVKEVRTVLAILHIPRSMPIKMFGKSAISHRLGSLNAHDDVKARTGREIFMRIFQKMGCIL